MKLKKNLIQLVESDYIPLSTSQEGALLGGFGSIAISPLGDISGNNAVCKNPTCSNADCVNPSCANGECANPVCANNCTTNNCNCSPSPSTATTDANINPFVIF